MQRELESSRSTLPPPRLLLVEDDEIDALSIQRSLNRLQSQLPLTRVTDSRAALDLLMARTDPNESFVILLDLNTPRMNGFEFLRATATHAIVPNFLTFILTTSSSPDDVRECYQHGAAGYLVKRGSSADFDDLMNKVSGYWEALEWP